MSGRWCCDQRLPSGVAGQAAFALLLTINLLFGLVN
jgi:hypothetical protein